MQLPSNSENPFAIAVQQQKLAEQRDEARTRVGELEDALRSIGVHFLQTPHNELGKACGQDACILCLAQSTALEALGDAQ